MKFPKEKKAVLAAVAASVLLTSFATYSAFSPPAEVPPLGVQPQLPDHRFFSYSAKFVCGVPQSAEIVRHSIKPGNYATNINVHNPFSEDAKFRWKAVQIKPVEAISNFTVVQLKPDQGVKIDCKSIQDALLPIPGASVTVFWEGVVVIETIKNLDVAVVYTSDDIIKEEKEKQEILFRFVESTPFKMHRVVKDGDTIPRVPEPLPSPGRTPPSGFSAELLAMDFEKVFENKKDILYEFCPIPDGVVDLVDSNQNEVPEVPCPGKGTREVAIIEPAIGQVFPRRPSAAFDSLEELVRDKDPHFVKIIAVEATLFQTNLIKQEATYRWVSDPLKIVGEFEQNVAIDPVIEVVGGIVNGVIPAPPEIDNDGDGITNEDPIGDSDNNGDLDDDTDGLTDEDGPLQIEILDTDIAAGVGVGKGHSEDIEYITPKVIRGIPDPSIK
jgi:hypothetical protein